MNKLAMTKLARALATAVLCTALPAGAADYPVRPVKVVVSFPPGGLTDVVARLLSARLGERLKQPVLVENKPGAGGVIGTEFTAKAAPDGYTMTFTANNHVIQPHLSKSLRYDARKDFSPVALVGYLPSAFIVHPSLPASNINQLIAHAKANPGKLAYGSWGVGTSAHVRTEMFKAEYNLDILHVPFQGAGPALNGVVAGQIQMMTIPMSLVEGNHKAGQVRMIGVTTAKRNPVAPDVATFTEQGQSLSGASWQGFVGPAGIAADIVTLLNREISAMVEEPQMRATLAKNGLEAATSTPAQFKSYLDSEYEYWGKAIRTANVPVE